MRHSKADLELANRVRTGLRPLFDDGAEIIFSERLPGEGNSHAILKVREIKLWIIQSGGGLSVLVSPSFATDSWNRIEFLLKAIEPEHSLPPDPVYGSLADLGLLLQSRLLAVNNALSQERFDSTVEAARQATRKGMIALTPCTAVAPRPRRRIGPLLIGGIVKLIRFVLPRQKNSHAKFLPVGSDVELERQVRDEFAVVFTNFGAVVSSNERMRTMDFATVTFDAGNLRVRASRDRGSIGIAIAPVHAVRFSHSLGIALQALREDGMDVQPIASSLLDGSGVLLERNFPRLNDAFSVANFAKLRERMLGIEKTARENWIEDFNRGSKLYHATTP
jgi:hypothetical protein